MWAHIGVVLGQGHSPGRFRWSGSDFLLDGVYGHHEDAACFRPRIREFSSFKEKPHASSACWETSERRSIGRVQLTL